MPSTTIRYSTLPENSHSIRLVSADRSGDGPASHTPGAYRYNPSHHDPSVPESDPRSPRYEPPHLRHRPGDTFEIGGKPFDPLDPGPFGTPGWRPDNRTGRHRRGELPDPEPEPDANREPGAGQHRHREPEPPPPAADARQRPNSNPYRRYRDWADHSDPYRFSPMREDAMRRFLELSQPFRDAHFEPEAPSLAARLVRLLRWFLWVVVCGLAPTSRSLAPTPTKPGPVTVPGLDEMQRQERPRPSPMPYIATWERRFDAQQPIAGGGTL
ncbi:hypothetical protein [Glycomyces tarimensis]